MKRILLFLLMMTIGLFAYSQTTYYWVGGAAPSGTGGMATTTYWNTALNGSGNPRPSNSGVNDILVFDGSNIGGISPATGTVTAPVNGSITCNQLKFVNNATVLLPRTASTGGTGTITINGDGDVYEDFVIESGSSVTLSTGTGSVRIAMAAPNAVATPNTGRVSGSLTMNTGFQARIDYTAVPNALPGSLVFKSGSTFTTNITAASASYAFGNTSQSPDSWVTFEAGSQLFYNGGYSPNGSGNLFSAIDMKPGSIWHHRVTNALTGAGNFFNRRGYGDISVENGATLNEMGPIYRIGNLTISAGSTFNTFSSGQTVVLGDLVVDGTMLSNVASTNELVMGGNVAQSVSGSGSINIASLTIADNANVKMNRNIDVDKFIRIYGKLDLSTSQLTGNALFTANAKSVPLPATGNFTTGAYVISVAPGTAALSKGLTVTGAGIAPNTSVVAISAGPLDTLYLSKPLLSAGSAVTLSIAGKGAILATANANGFDPATGSVMSAGNRTYADGINYIINGPTSWPFGESTGSSNTNINADFIEINAAVTVNKNVTINDHLTLNGKMSLRPLDVLHINAGATINGNIGASNYIATGYNTSAGTQSLVQYDGISTSTIIPIGTANYYLPVTVNPASAGNFTASVFEGITANGTINGTAFSPLQKLKFVNAVWNVNRLTGTGNSDLTLQWNEALEGTTFATLANTDIGLVQNLGSSYSIPMGVADNTANTTTATITSYGAFSASAVPQTEPFLFNDLPGKTYGNADFNGGASSLNFDEPIIYTSSNLNVATIVNGNIHIIGAGTTDIKASQAANGSYPAVSLTKSLTVEKAPLTITADDKIRFEALANPPLTITYTGFVLGETAAVFLTPPVITTSAVLASAPGSYPITVNGATAANYTISFVNGVITVKPKQVQTITFNAFPAKTYGNADFAIGASSNNTTIPVIVTSSNTNVATIVGNNVHIVGAGSANITAAQAGTDSYFAAPNVVQMVTVSKAPLTIRVRDTTRLEGQANPPFTITYSGFVLGQSPANLLTPVTVTTTAGINSTGGNYPITLAGGTSNNYAVTYTNGRLTVLPPDGGTVQYIQAFVSNSSTLTIRVFSLKPGLADITLYDFAGRPLLRKNLFMPVGFINSDLPIGKMPAGIYNVTIKGNGVDLKKTVAIIK